MTTSANRQINTYFMFPDLSQFITSDFYNNNTHLITVYPPVKQIFNAVPPYKPYRIVVRSMGENYHTVFTIDANASTYDDICDELTDIGGVNQVSWGMEKSANATKNDVLQAKGNEETLKNYELTHPQQSSNTSESGWDGFTSGFNSVLDLAKDFF